MKNIAEITTKFRMKSLIWLNIFEKVYYMPGSKRLKNRGT